MAISRRVPPALEYRNEVPGRHRRWPESIKSRVGELHGMGVKFAVIARKTGIPYYTVLKWRDEPREHFRMVNVVEAKNVATVAVAKVGSVTEPSLEGAVVHFPNGVRIERASAALLKQLLPDLVGST